MQAKEWKTVLHVYLWLILGFYAVDTHAQCAGVVDLGNDTAIAFCTGATLTLDGGTWDTYLWNTGSITSTITVTTPGTYWLTTLDPTGNLVFNGDFEVGDTAFTSSYAYSTNLWSEGLYWVGANPTSVHPNFFGSDHTTGTGNLLVVNGSGTPGTAVWCQSVTVDPNTDYDFSAWVSSMVASSPALLQFEINGVTIGPVFTAPLTTFTWEQFNAVWNSGTATTADICILNQNTTLSGNDFGLDDIALSTICEYTDSIYVNDLESPMAIAPMLPLTICGGDTITLSSLASGGYGTLVYSWDNGVLGNDLTVSPTQDTVYTAIVTDDCGNIITETVEVFVSQPLIEVDYTLADCATFQFMQLGNLPHQYFWEFGDGFASDEREPEHSYQVIGAFEVNILAIDSLGCENDSTLSVLASADILGVPNAFTPNGDLLNDHFKPIPGCAAFSAEGYRFQVFNRWGTMIFETSDPARAWDGTYQGRTAEFGSYIWQLVYNKFTIFGPEPQQLAGTVTLLH